MRDAELDALRHVCGECGQVIEPYRTDGVEMWQHCDYSQPPAGHVAYQSKPKPASEWSPDGIARLAAAAIGTTKEPKSAPDSEPKGANARNGCPACARWWKCVMVQKREDNGRYDLTGGSDRVCVCGCTLGIHSAKAPHECFAYSMPSDRDTSPIAVAPSSGNRARMQ